MPGRDSRDLDKVSKRIEDFYDDSTARIRAAYDNSIDQPRHYPELDKPPHQLIIRDAAEVIDYTLSNNQDIQIKDKDKGYQLTRRTMYGVGTEYLLNGYDLKVNTEEFITYLENNEGKSPAFPSIKGRMLNDLSCDLTPPQIKRINQGLELIWLQRNNAVHFPFHRKQEIVEFRVIENCLRFLLERYSDEELGVVPKLEERVESKLQNSRESSVEHIEFP